VVTGLVVAPDPTMTPLLLVARDDGDVVAVAMQTPPYPLGVLADPNGARRGEAITALAAAVLAEGPAPEVATGPRSDLTDLGAALTADGALVAREHAPMLLYRLDGLIEPRRARGAARRLDPSEPADRDLMATWFYDFQVETGGVPAPQAPDPDVLVTREARGARHLLWVVDGRPVALAGHSLVVAGMARIGPVYTPEPSRRHGYGSAVTAAAVRAAHAAGADEVVLFTDADYAPSNAVYRGLGFRAVETYADLRFEPAAR
jgi:GNAT superfamily N-acetyltransferase